MPATVSAAAIPVPTKDNIVQVLTAIRNAMISATNVDAGRANTAGTVPANNPATQQMPSPSQFVVTNQVVNNITIKTTNGDTVTIPTLVSLTLVNQVTGQTWFWEAPSTITQKGTTTSVTTAAAAGSGIVFDIAAKFTGAGTVLSSGAFVDVEVDFACTINKVTLLGSPSGSVTLNIYKCTSGQYDGGSTHPTSGDSITASDTPALSSAAYYTDAGLTGWTTAISAGDVLRFIITGTPATITDLTVSLECTRS